MKIWAVCDGAYEDWRPIALFLERVEAEKYAKAYETRDIEEFGLFSSALEALTNDAQDAKTSKYSSESEIARCEARLLKVNVIDAEHPASA